VRPPLSPIQITLLADRHRDFLAPRLLPLLENLLNRYAIPEWDPLINSLIAVHLAILNSEMPRLESIEKSGQWREKLDECILKAGGSLNPTAPTTELENSLIHAFSYDAFVRGWKNYSAHALSQALQVKTCLYCNMYPISYVPAETTDQTDYRPPFDHWLSKSRHPWFAISFFNLIPACDPCNSPGIKGSAEFSYETHAHPYLDCIDELAEFTLVETRSTPYFSHPDIIDCRMRLAIRNRNSGSRYGESERVLTELRICSRYMSNGSRIEDFLKARQQLGRNRSRLLECDLQQSIDRKEFLRNLLGASGQDEDVHLRPFAKVMNDLLRQFSI
jgi:hypothetical protein